MHPSSTVTQTSQQIDADGKMPATFVCTLVCCSITLLPDVLVGLGFGDTRPTTLAVKAAR